MPITPGRRLWALALVTLGSAGAAAIWTLVAVALNRQVSWMGILAAVDVALLLRLAGIPRGAGRSSIAIIATLAAIALANWWIAGAQVGAMVGMLPWQSIPRIGAHYTWTLTSLANGTMDVLWYAAAVVVAAVAAR